MNYPNRTIKYGEKDSKIVKHIQKRLNELGCGPLVVDGDFGPKTRGAVKLFQSTHFDYLGNHLLIDGKIGPLTWNSMFDIETDDSDPEITDELLSEVMKIADSQIGVMEEPVGSNKGPEVNEYLKSVGLGPGYYWCAAFVYWCFNEAAKGIGVDNPLPKTAGCMNHWRRSKGKKIAGKDAQDNPSLIVPGSVFIINHGGGKGHTGIVRKVVSGYVHTIEGNSNPNGSRNGIGVFNITRRKVNSINQGYILY